MPCACRGAFATSTVATAAAAAPLRACEIFALHALLRGPCKWWPWRRRRHTVQQAHGWQRSLEVGCKSRQATSKEVKALCWPWKADCLTTTVYANFEGCHRRVAAHRARCAVGLVLLQTRHHGDANLAPRARRRLATVLGGREAMSAFTLELQKVHPLGKGRRLKLGNGG